jgi:hypothetical protein
MARPDGLEPPTTWFEARCSIQLSYGRAVGRLSCRCPVDDNPSRRRAGTCFPARGPHVILACLAPRPIARAGRASRRARRLPTISLRAQAAATHLPRAPAFTGGLARCGRMHQRDITQVAPEVAIRGLNPPTSKRTHLETPTELGAGSSSQFPALRASCTNQELLRTAQLASELRRLRVSPVDRQRSAAFAAAPLRHPAVQATGRHWHIEASIPVAAPGLAIFRFKS